MSEAVFATLVIAATRVAALQQQLQSERDREEAPIDPAAASADWLAASMASLQRFAAIEALVLELDRAIGVLAVVASQARELLTKVQLDHASAMLDLALKRPVAPPL